MSKTSNPQSNGADTNESARQHNDFQVIGIDAGVGGLEALKVFLNNLPADNKRPIVIIPQFNRESVARGLESTSGQGSILQNETKNELNHAKQKLQIAIGELEATNKKLHATNKEMLATNDELHSANKEIQNVNEELHIVNTKLQEKILEATILNTDMDNLLKSTNVGTIFIDRNMLIRRFTPAIREQFSLSESDIGKPINTFCGVLGNNDLVTRAKKVIKNGQIYRKEILSGNGKWFQKQIFPFVDTDNTIQGVVITFVDIDELKSYEQALKNRITEIKEQNIKLEKSKIAMLNIMEDLKDEKEKLMSSQQFLAKMSHEIRTPLNAVIGMAHLLYDTEPTPVQKEYLTILKSSSDILQALISGILDYSKIEAGEIEVKRKEFDLIGLLKALQRTFQLKMEDHPVNIELEIDKSIQTLLVGDDLLLNQILINLLSNATKFTKEGIIGIRAKLLEVKGNHLRIKFMVYDTGTGILPEHLDTIFEKFKQSDNEFQIKYRGTGLGLAITRQLVELQGGEIKVKSKVDKGSVFSFTLTYEDSGMKLEEIAGELPVVSDAKVSNSHILVAEDNFMNRKYISTLLQKWKVSFEMAYNGKQALELAKKIKFDLIMMDVIMPEMNGYEATIAIRNTAPLNKQTPIVALTASAVISEKEKAFGAGMTGFLPKPFKPIQLLQIIKQYSPTNNIKPIKSNDKPSFSFDSSLNADFLNECYEGDLAYSMDMFSIFLSHTIQEMKDLRSLILFKNWDTARKLTHKLKPTFSMVGLTWLEDKMQILETAIDEQPDQTKILALLNEIEDAVFKSIPLLTRELDRMEKHLNSIN